MRFTFLLALCVCLPVTAAAQSKPPGQSSRPGWPCAGNVDPSYVHVAEATGGKVLLFHPTEISGMAIDHLASERHEETVFRAVGQLAGETYEMAVPIDTTIESAYFAVSIQCLQLATLVTPSGQELSAATPGVEYHQFESIRLFVVPKPAPGVWKLIAAGKGFFSAIVTARTELQLGQVTFVDAAAPGATPAVAASVRGAFQRVAFHFVAANAELIESLQLAVHDKSEEGASYSGPARRPRKDFRVAVTGVDAAGFPFQRMESRLSDGTASPR
jgi:hypothetical protein